jgi:LacI family transcriptional regulator, gluconate utilization system Gnt-I transcriptional repressor
VARQRSPPHAVSSAPRRRPRLLDVADAAGVSTMTVVRVMRDPTKVAPRTRERVEAVLRQTGYTPDLTARGLASNRSGLIAAIIPVLTNSLIAEIMQGLSDALAPSDYHLLLGASGFSSAQEEVMVRAFLSRRVDGIYLTGVIHTPETVRMLTHAGIPVVEGGNLTADPIDMVVGYSNVDAAREITRYLVGKRYAPIGYIGAFPADNDRARDRRLGYEAALRTARRGIDPTLCVETTLDVDAGAEAMAALLARRPDVRAVFCSADALAIGALYECQRSGLDVPGDIAIAGFDDIPLAAQVVPSLTTVQVRRYAIGERAGKLIGDRLAKRAVWRRIVDTGYKLVPRDSA